MSKYWAVALGGAIGASLRLILTEWSQSRTNMSFPYGTILVNMLGAFTIGILMSWLLSRPDIPAWIKLFAVTGILGGLTTFSTFSYEWVALVQSRDFMGALLYGGGQLIGGFVLCWLGLFIGRLLV